MFEDNTDKLAEGKRFKGYCVDLMNKLEEELGFTGNMYLVDDGNYGRMDPITKQWNGIVGDVYSKVR